METEKQSFQDFINDEKAIPLSDEDIMQLLQGDTKIYKHSDLANVQSIHEALYPYDNFVVLYGADDGQVGHWIVVLKVGGNRLEVFDPLGLPPWSEVTLKYEKRPYLCDLLLKDDCRFKLSWNEFPFQKNAEDVSSCGRWCVLRVRTSFMTLYEFKNIFLLKDGDDVATFLTL